MLFPNCDCLMATFMFLLLCFWFPLDVSVCYSDLVLLCVAEVPVLSVVFSFFFCFVFNWFVYSAILLEFSWICEISDWSWYRGIELYVIWNSHWFGRARGFPLQRPWINYSVATVCHVMLLVFCPNHVTSLHRLFHSCHQF